MTPEQTFWVAIFTALSTTVLVPIITWILGRLKSKTQVQIDVLQSAGEIMEGGEKAVAAFERLLERYEKQNLQLIADNNANKAEIVALRAQITSMQIDEDSKRKRLIVRLEAQEAYIKLLVSLLEKYIPKEEIPPMPEALTESQTKIQAIK